MEKRKYFLKNNIKKTCLFLFFPASTVQTIHQANPISCQKYSSVQKCKGVRGETYILSNYSHLGNRRKMVSATSLQNSFLKRGKRTEDVLLRLLHHLVLDEMN